MRFIGGLLIFLLAVPAFRWCAGEIAVQSLGHETKATVTSVSKGGTRHPSYTANYEFVTTDMSTGHGSCPSHKGATGGSVRIRYLQHAPSFNTPTVWWYAGFWMLAYGAVAWPLALWSARTFLFRRLHRFGEPEEEEEDDKDAEDADEKPEDDEADAEEAEKPAPVADALPVPFHNRWSAAILLSLGLSAVAIAANLAWFDAREKAFVQNQTAATLPQSPTDPSAPASASAPLPRGASAGNVANGCDLGFDGDAFYVGLWQDYDNPSAPAPGLYRFALDGSGRTPVGDPGDTANIYAGIQVLDDWIYYRAMEGIHRIRKDGSRARRLTKSDVTSMAVVGDWIYFQVKALDGAISRMRLDGGGETRLCQEPVGEMCVADDGWIYYANMIDRGQLWRMKLDGTGRARLAGRRVGKLLVAGGSIWFTDPDRNSALCRMDTTGAGAEVVAEDSVWALNWADGRIYFNRSNGEAARCKPDGTELETVAPAATEILIHGDHLFVRPDIEQRVFRRSKLDGSAPIEIRF